MKRRFVAILLALALPFVCIAQDNFQEYLVDFISTKQGLSHNYVTSIVSDDLNIKWIGTENGITKFDGYNFDYIKPNKAYAGLLNENIEILFTDRNHNLWIGTKSGGLSFFDLKNNVIKNFNHLIDLNKDGDMRITSLSEDHQGHIWVGTWNKGVFVIDPEKEKLFKLFHSNQTIYSITCDWKGTTWFSNGSTLSRYDTLNQKIIEYKTSGIITDLLPDPKRNQLWISFSGRKSHLYKYNFSDDSIDSISTNVPSQFARKLSLDKHGRIWIGTWGKGVYRSSDDLTEFHKVALNIKGQRKVNGNYETILDIHHDKNNITWLATANAGIIKLLEGKGFTNADQLVSNGNITELLNCNALFKTKDKLYVGSTYGGVYQGKDFSDLKSFEEINNVRVNAFYENSGKLYIGTADGFEILDLNNNTVIYKSQPWIKKVTSFLIANDTLYFGTQQMGLGIVQLDELENRESYQWYREQAIDYSKIESNRITEIKKDNEGHIWVSTYNGLHLYEPETRKFIHHTQLLKSTLPSAIINAMLIQGPFIWLATPNGLIKLKKKERALNIAY